MLPIKAVCFDLGGVLIQIHHEWDGALRAVGLSGSFGPLGGFPEFDRYQAGEIGTGDYSLALAQYIGVEPEQAMKAHMAILREEYPGVAQLIEELRGHGLVCGCLSNTNASHWATFFDSGRYEFGPLLRVRIGSHLVQANKPNERIYREFEAASGLNGDKIAYFDDTVANVVAAQRIGWRAWQIDPTGDTVVQVSEALEL